MPFCASNVVLKRALQHERLCVFVRLLQSSTSVADVAWAGD
jgi:hypothetical protein